MSSYLKGIDLLEFENSELIEYWSYIVSAIEEL